MDQFLTLSSNVAGDSAVFSLAVLLALSWRNYRRTSLRHAVVWFGVAWLAWLTLLLINLAELPAAPWRYLSLCLTACSGVAVLGARQPGMAAWNFVVAGLLAVLSLPLLEQPWHAPVWRLDEPRGIFVAFLLVVGVVNYMPTRWAMAATAAGVWFGVELRALTLAPGAAHDSLLGGLAALCAWWGFLRRRDTPANDVDAAWLAFRDAYGLVWGLRALEQFNSAARNSGWGPRLTWRGLARPPNHSIGNTELREEMLQTLRAILQRFTPV